MKKLFTLVIVGMVIVLIISAAVLLNRSGSEKKSVYYKIEEYRKEVVVTTPFPVLPKKKNKTVESKPLLTQDEISPGYKIDQAEEKRDSIMPAEKEKPVLPASKKGSKEISGQLVFDDRKVQGQTVETISPIQELKKTDLEKNQEIPKENDEHKEPVFRLYHATGEDTLWDIAEKYYGKGSYYPVLLEHNPNAGIYDIGKDVTLKILSNKERAAKIYKKIVIKKEGHLFWRYSVVRGDTMQSIIKKYYKKGRGKSDIPNFDKDSELEPGEKIWILIN